MRPAAATALLGIGLLLVAATFDAEPLYVPGVGFLLLAAASAAWVAAGARGVRIERTVGLRRVVEEQPVRVDVLVSAGRLPLPSGLIDDPLLPAPAAMAAGRRRTRVRINARFARRGRKVLAAPRVIVRDPFGLATRVVAADEPAELLVLPRLEPVRAGPGGGDGTGLAVRRGRSRRGGRDRPRRPAPAPRGDAGLAHLLAGAGARRRVDGASPARRRRHAPARRRSTRARRPRRPSSTRPSAPPPRSASTWPARAAARCCSRATAGRPTWSRRSRAGRTLHVRLALVDDRRGPTSPASRPGAARCSTSPRAPACGRPPRCCTRPGPGACSWSPG